MSYLGNPPAEAFTTTVKDSFDGDGSTTGFTMSQPSVTNDVRVVVENVVQDPTVAYTCAGTTLTFTSAPPAGTGNIYVVHLGPAIQTAQPPAEIANATSFLSSVTVQGAFTSLGIDDNATSTAMTLDTSGNLLVGKTSSNTGSLGVEFRQDGLGVFGRSADYPLILNRTTNDGGILLFRKDGSTVGSIGSIGGDIFVGTGDTTLRFYDAGNAITPRGTDGAANNGVIDLGGSSERFKDGHFSGTVSATAFTGDGSALTGVGASTTYGAVGTYVTAMFASNNSTISGGATIAGSSLRQHNDGAGNGILPLKENLTGTEHASAGLSGTWRQMAPEAAFGTAIDSNKLVGALFLRIS
jgi:hypothetical protein